MSPQVLGCRKRGNASSTLRDASPWNIALWLYWSMYCMLSSSQPLIRTFVSFNLSHSFEKWLWFLVLSFLFKGESFSFASGLWVLDLDNGKTFLVEIFGSPLHLVFLDGDWKVFCFLAFGKLLRDLYFFGDHCLVYRRMTSAWAFLQGDLNSLGLSSFFIRGFSLVSLLSMTSSCYFSIASSFFLMLQQIWYGWRLLCRERAHWLPRANTRHRARFNLLKLIGMAGIIIIKASTSISR